MSGPVDVLGSMELHADTAERSRANALNCGQKVAAGVYLLERDEAIAARAAVAELIEASTAYHDAMIPGVSIRDRVAAGRRLDAALGRIGAQS